MGGSHDATVVAAQLGLQDDSSELLTLADQRWSEWVAARPELGAVPDGVPGLRRWLTSAPQEDADCVLLGLAALAATDGGDDLVAASTLAWALLPGACVLAGPLRGLSDRIGELVAAQLWVEVRTFPWQRLTKVSSNVLLNTRAAVLRECGAVAQTARADRTWSRTTPVDPASPAWGSVLAPDPGERQTTPADVLLQVLDWGCRSKVISPEDRKLLLSLVQAADEAAKPPPAREGGGLMGDDISARVGEQWGISASTVKRRVRRSVEALAAAPAGPGWRISA